jgi:hypothetical protein
MRTAKNGKVERSKSKEQDKYAGDHQGEHPDKIDVEPRAPQYCQAKLFINQNRDQRGR